jgi:hypothetical protein
VPFPVSKPVAYYFDSVAGSDNNNWLSTRAPCASTTKMAALRYRGGDTINWKAGSSFTGCPQNSSGSSTPSFVIDCLSGFYPHPQDVVCFQAPE